MKKGMKILVLALAVMIVFGTTSTVLAAESHSHGSGSYTVSSYDQLGQTNVNNCTGVTQAGVTDAITSTSHCGNGLYNGELMKKAIAVSGSTTDRVRLEGLRIDPNYTSNWVGENYNTTSRYVQLVQNYMSYTGYPVGTIDGKWGSKTLDCIKKFQARNGLTADGVLGTSSWRKFCSYVTGY